jgi:hypothetical protein
MFDEIYNELELAIKKKQKDFDNNQKDVVKLNYTEADKKSLRMRFKNTIKAHADGLEAFICFCEAFIGKEACVGKKRNVYPIFLKDRNGTICNPDFVTGCILIGAFLEMFRNKHQFKKSIKNDVDTAKNDFLKNGLDIEKLKVHLRCIW